MCEGFQMRNVECLELLKEVALQRDFSLLLFMKKKRDFILNNNVKLCPVTIIWSDKWRTYHGSKRMYDHLVVNHSLYFVDPETSIQTQNIEFLWSQLKY